MRSIKFFSVRQILVFAVLFFAGVSVTNARILILPETGFYSFGNKKHPLENSQIQMLENDLREKTGLKGLGFNYDGELDYDVWENATSGSEKLRETIIGAIDDELNIFQINSYSNSKDIHFAQTDAGTIDVNTGITTYELFFDFADFESAKKLSREEAIESFSLSINLFHEIDHKVGYRPLRYFEGVRPEISSRHIVGVRENTNFVRSELGLVLRDAKQIGAQKFSMNVYKIKFVERSGKSYFLRWRINGK